MKFKLELLIAKPITEVWMFFMDPDKTKRWQPSLTGIEPVSGTAGQPGAVSTWTYKESEKEFSLTETVLQREEAHKYKSVFENKFATNIVSHQFMEQGDNETLWTMETQYRFRTFLMKLLGPVFKRNYVARSQKEMERFKDEVEKGQDIE